MGSSIAARLTWVNILVSAAALLLAGVALGTYDRASFREKTLRNLSIQAQIVGANCVSALVFSDPHAAEVTLGALSASPNIISADIYTPEGRIFARYRRQDGSDARSAPQIPPGQAETYRFEGDEIAFARRVMFGGKPAGTVFIRSDTQELITRRTQYLGMIASVLAASLIAALLMSWLSHRVVSQPIVELAAVARAVSHDKNYSVRVPAVSGRVDEIAVLTGAFNEMLSQIQARDTSLHEAQQVLETRVRQRTSELEAVNKELEAFTYSVSHDLRAPLRHVTGFAGLLEEHAKGQLDDEGRRYMQTIVRAAKRMGQLIDDLLAFSRIGRSQLTARRVNLNELLREARDEVVTPDGIAQRDIEWQAADLPEVEGDPALLRLVMINLLSNAVKYTSPRPTARIEIGTSPNGQDETVVFVRDNGVGFDMQYADKLFGVFQRLHSTDEFEGTGIGLANVRRIIQRHGGRVWADSQVDSGATFYFSLPRTGRA